MLCYVRSRRVSTFTPRLETIHSRLLLRDEEPEAEMGSVPERDWAGYRGVEPQSNREADVGRRARGRGPGV